MNTEQPHAELPTSYDLVQLKYLRRCIREEHRSFCLEKGGRGPWRTEFRKYVNVTIAEYVERFGPFVIRGSASPFDYEGAVTPEGMLKFARFHGETEVARLPTLHVADAFLRASAHPAAAPASDVTSIVRTLGRSTALQYHDPSRDILAQKTFFTGVCGLHQLRGVQVHVPGPVAPDTLLVWLQKVPRETFVICRVVVLSTEEDRSRFARSVKDKSDWMEDHFVGFGVMSREGLSCHLTSTTAKIPLYLLLKLDENVDEEPATAAFVSYSSPGYIAEYQRLNRLSKTNLSEYFDSRAWMI